MAPEEQQKWCKAVSDGAMAVAKSFEAKKKPKENEHWLEIAANYGSSEAQCRRGTIYIQN